MNEILNVMWRKNRIEILSGHTYEFRNDDSCVRVELVLLPDGLYRIKPLLVIRGKNQEGVRTFLSILPMTGDFENTSFTLQSSIDIALMRGWNVNDLTKNSNAE